VGFAIPNQIALADYKLGVFGRCRHRPICHSEQSEELSLERSEKSSTRDINADKYSGDLSIEEDSSLRSE